MQEQTIKTQKEHIYERARFQDRLDLIIDEFCGQLSQEGTDNETIDFIKKSCTMFIGFIATRSETIELTEISRTMAYSKYRAWLNSKKEFKVNTEVANKYRQSDHSLVIKDFFAFLHRQKGITNKNVLKAFYSNDELKEMGVK